MFDLLSTLLLVILPTFVFTKGDAEHELFLKGELVFLSARLGGISFLPLLVNPLIPEMLGTSVS
jgi:hypothetical protein